MPRGVPKSGSRKAGTGGFKKVRGGKIRYVRPRKGSFPVKT
jgi:hypothetical protein